MQYPKIETLFDRNEDTHKVIPGQLRCPEFGLIDRWFITEKIDGTNIRVCVTPNRSLMLPPIAPGGYMPTEVEFFGKTDKAEIPPFLLAQLKAMFPPEAFGPVFGDHTDIERLWLFGEGYGERIQKGGGNYRQGVSFRLFDVVVEDDENKQWWLKWADVEDIANKLGIKTVPVLNDNCDTDFAVGVVQEGGCMYSAVAWQDHGEEHHQNVMAEGIVARTNPYLYTNQGKRVVWKLKTKDFERAAWEMAE